MKEPVSSIGCIAGPSGLERILPFQPRKAAEITIGGVEHRSVFDRERGEMRVHNQ